MTFVAVQEKIVEKLTRIERSCGDCSDVKDKVGVVRYVRCTNRYLGCWSTAPHAFVLTLMRQHYYCVYLYSVYAVSVDLLTHAVDLHKTASR